jgi:hypothetical protein
MPYSFSSPQAHRQTIGAGASDHSAAEFRAMPQPTENREDCWSGDRGNALLTPEQVAERLCVSVDWVRDHSSRKNPRLPVIRLGGGPGHKGLLRYRASEIEKFISELERLSSLGRGYNSSTPPIAAPKRETYGKEVVSEGVDSPQR